MADPLDCAASRLRQPHARHECCRTRIALGDDMPDAAWQALAAQWSERSLARCHPETANPSLTGIRCKSCRKNHKCHHRGKEGHLPEPQTEDEDTDEEECEIDQMDEHVQRCIADMKKAGARTTWAGWFPKSFAKLLASFHIEATEAHRMALRIRAVITNGMDEIWRERNAAQHHPKERKEIDELITEEYDKRIALRMDPTPYHSAAEIHARPFRCKKAWLKNSKERTGKKIEEKERGAKARRAIAEGKCPVWNKEAEKKATTRRTTRPTKRRIDGPRQKEQAAPLQKNPWDSYPTVAPCGSTTSERQARSAGAASAATATASVAARRPRPTTAKTTLPPSTDLKRKRSERQPELHRWLALRRRTDGEDDGRNEQEGSERRTETKGQSDDPDLIDDVV